MRKRLDEAAMRNELADSAFFRQGQAAQMPAVNHEPTPPAATAGYTGGMPPRSHATMAPSDGDEGLIETIRKAVRALGKEEATYRLTPAEKRMMTEVVYSYGVAGVRTSQNEITRIAVNYLLEDYKAKGAHSLLARVLERLKA